MIKTTFLLIGFLFIPSLINAQLFPYNPRKWDANWTYTKFSDSFNGTLLDKDKWDVMINYGRGKCVFVDSVGTTYSVNNGLNLSMIYHPGYCYRDGTIQCRDYISAEIWSKDKFKYGIYEGRMKFATGGGSWPAFWFFGSVGADDPQYDSIYSSEIDIAEYNWHHKDWPWSGYYVNTDHVFHWWWPESIYGTRQMDIYDPIKNNSVNWNTSHTFKLIYTPYDCTFYIDGTFSWRRSRFYKVVDQVPVDLFPLQLNENTQYLENEWFPKHEGKIILSQQVAGNVYNGDISAPQTSLFEWVTFKQFFLAPEITINNISCLASTATLDIDPAATNITWQLTPSTLFTTLNGTGKIANIAKASGANGEGKITYSFQMPSGETFTVEKDIWVGTPHDIELVCEGGGGMVGDYYAFYVTPFNPEYDQLSWGTYPPPAELVDLGYGYASIRFGAPGNYDIWAYIVNDCGYGTPSYIHNIVVQELLMSPNPASNEVEITMSTGEAEGSKSASLSSDDAYTVTVLDIYGTVKIQKKYSGNKFTIPVSSLKDGNYFVKVNNKKINSSKQLIIKH